MITVQQKLARYYATVPSSFYQPSVNLETLGLLTAWATEDAAILNELESLRLEFFVATADGIFLDMLGSDVGVSRPSDFLNDDDHYRELIALAYSPHVNEASYDELFDIIFGPLASRSYVVSREPENYTLLQSIDFATDGTLVGTFTTDSDLGLKHTIDDSPLLDEDFRIQRDTVGFQLEVLATLSGLTAPPAPYTVEVDDGDTDLTLFTTLANSKILTLEVLIIRTESGIQTVTFLSSDFPDLLNVTVQQAATIINERQTLATADVFFNMTDSQNYLRIRTNTPGSSGFIQILGGTSNATFCFDHNIHRNFEVDIDETGDDPVIIIPQVSLTNRDLRGSWHFHDDPATIPFINTHLGQMANQLIWDTYPSTEATPYWPGPFLFHSLPSTDVSPVFPAAAYTLHSVSTTLTSPLEHGTSASAGPNIYPTPVDDSSQFPNPSVGAESYIMISLGEGNQEGPTRERADLLLKYLARTGNHSLNLDPLYQFGLTLDPVFPVSIPGFRFDHISGEIVNLVSYSSSSDKDGSGFRSLSGGYEPRKDGKDYGVYLTESRATDEVIEEILSTMGVAGLASQFEVNEIHYRYETI